MTDQKSGYSAVVGLGVGPTNDSPMSAGKVAYSGKGWRCKGGGLGA